MERRMDQPDNERKRRPSIAGKEAGGERVSKVAPTLLSNCVVPIKYSQSSNKSGVLENAAVQQC
ncbi:MAG TPA: hypothetical protein VN611_17375 [Patescibacteria group bacterium]|nr:hypothetical protein [Patescibacteria group bacterium]